MIGETLRHGAQRANYRHQARVPQSERLEEDTSVAFSPVVVWTIVLLVSLLLWWVIWWAASSLVSALL